MEQGYVIGYGSYLGERVELDPTHLQHFSSKSLRSILNKHFYEIKIVPAVGKYISLSKNLFANYLLFSADRPRK